MHVAFLCLESQKTQDLQHKNTRIFIYERRKSKHMEFPSLTWVSSYIILHMHEIAIQIFLVF